MPTNLSLPGWFGTCFSMLKDPLAPPVVTVVSTVWPDRDELRRAVVDVVDVDRLVGVRPDQLFWGLDVGVGTVRRRAVEGQGAGCIRVVALGRERDTGGRGDDERGQEQCRLRAASYSHP